MPAAGRVHGREPPSEPTASSGSVSVRTGGAASRGSAPVDRLDHVALELEGGRLDQPVRSAHDQPGQTVDRVEAGRQVGASSPSDGAGQERRHAVARPRGRSAPRGTLPPPSATRRASLARRLVSVARSPDRDAAMNAETSSACFGSTALAAGSRRHSRRPAVLRGRASRARLASWRQAASLRPKRVGHLRERVVEHVVQQERRPLERRQPVQRQQQRHRQVLGHLGLRVGRQRRGVRRPDPAATARRTPRAAPAPTSARRGRSASSS